MMRKAILLAALLFLALPAAAQQSTYGDITASASACAGNFNSSACVRLPMPANQATVSVTVLGTFTATLAVERSANNGGSWVSAGGNITATGTSTYAVAGYTDFRVRGSAYTSGSAKITITSSSAASGSITSGSGAPSGSCGVEDLYVDTATGDLYDCVAGVWTLITGSGGAPAFSAITSATNTTAAMVVGTGASLTVSGTGTNNATSFLGVTSVDATEFGYLNGVTSAIQTQLGLKAPLASPTFTGTVTIPTPFTLGAVSTTTTGAQLNFWNTLTGVSGSGTTGLLSTITSIADYDQLVSVSGNWVNSAVLLPNRTDSDGTFALVTADKRQLVTAAHATLNTGTIDQAGAAGFPDGWFTTFCTTGVGQSKITPTTSTIGGYAELYLAAGDCVRLYSDGTNYRALPSRMLDSFGFMLGADNGAALVTGDDQASIFVNRTGRTITIVSVWIEADAVDASASWNLQRDDGSPANILTANLTAHTTAKTACASGCDTTLTAEAVVLNGERIDLLTVTASAAKRATIWVVYR